LSLDFETTEQAAPTKVRLGFQILYQIVPHILNDGVFIGDRIATAYTWYMFLCKIGRCPNDIPDNPSKWGMSELTKVSQHLVDYASRLLKFVVTEY